MRPQRKALKSKAHGLLKLLLTFSRLIARELKVSMESHTLSQTHPSLIPPPTTPFFVQSISACHSPSYRARTCRAASYSNLTKFGTRNVFDIFCHIRARTTTQIDECIQFHSQACYPHLNPPNPQTCASLISHQNPHILPFRCDITTADSFGMQVKMGGDDKVMGQGPFGASYYLKGALAGGICCSLTHGNLASPRLLSAANYILQ